MNSYIHSTYAFMGIMKMVKKQKKNSKENENQITVFNAFKKIYKLRQNTKKKNLFTCGVRSIR